MTSPLTLVAILDIAHLTVRVYEGPLPEGVFGRFDYETACIMVRPDLKPPHKLEVFWHEVMHAALWAYGHDDRKMDEEAVCTAVGKIMAALWITNARTLAEIYGRYNGKETPNAA
jgi:hypothetical protein